MSISITIRRVPDEVRDELAARAARSGRSLQEYLLRELMDMVARPSVDEWFARVRARVEEADLTAAPRIRMLTGVVASE